MSGARFVSKSQISDLRSQISGLGSQVSGLRSRVSGLRSQVSDLRSQIADRRSQRAHIAQKAPAQTILNNTAEASSTRNSANTPVNFPPSVFASDRVTKLSAINVAEAVSDSVSFVPWVRCLGQITFEWACISSSRQVTGSLNRFLKGLRRELGLVVLIFPTPRNYWRRGSGPDESEAGNDHADARNHENTAKSRRIPALVYTIRSMRYTMWGTTLKILDFRLLIESIGDCQVPIAV